LFYNVVKRINQNTVLIRLSFQKTILYFLIILLPDIITYFVPVSYFSEISKHIPINLTKVK